MKLKYDEALSNFAYNFNLCRYMLAKIRRNTLKSFDLQASSVSG